MTHNDAYIFDAVHTPRGKRKGSLSGIHPMDLYGYPIKAIIERTGIDPAAIEDVVTGIVSQAGEQGQCMPKAALLAAGLPETIPGIAIDRFCGSGLQAVNYAAMGVQSGNMDLVLAGGVEAMSRMPIGSAWDAERPVSLTSRYNLGTQYEAAELIAETWNISRTECDEFAVRSQERAATSWNEKRFDHELCQVPFTTEDGQEAVCIRDEHPRAGTTVETLSGLKSLVKEHGVVTAGNASGVVDGAASVLVGSEQAKNKYGLTPRAKITAMEVYGSDPILMLTGIIPATERVLKKAGLSIDDIDLIEINEAFAPIPMAWEREFKTGFDKINVNGGAIALGHPLGATGSILTATIINELERQDLRYGLITICMGFGMGIATIVDRNVH